MNDTLLRISNDVAPRFERAPDGAGPGGLALDEDPWAHGLGKVRRKPLQVELRRAPCISGPRLAEYAGLWKAARRHEILRNFKYSSVAKRAWHTRARAAATLALVSGSPMPLIETLERLRVLTDATEMQRRRRVADMKALEAFLAIFPTVYARAGGGTLQLQRARSPRERCPRLHIAGVEVNVGPDVLAIGRRGVGLVKLNFAQTKTHRFDEQSGLYAATLVEQHARTHLEPLGLPLRRRCLVVDVFNGAEGIFAAPKCYKQRQRQLRATCEEIARVWPAIECPPNAEIVLRPQRSTPDV